MVAHIEIVFTEDIRKIEDNFGVSLGIGDLRILQLDRKTSLAEFGPPRQGRTRIGDTIVYSIELYAPFRARLNDSPISVLTSDMLVFSLSSADEGRVDKLLEIYNDYAESIRVEVVVNGIGLLDETFDSLSFSKAFNRAHD